MYKCFPILVLLILFGSYSDHTVAQETGTGTRPPNNLQNQNPSTSAPMVMPDSTERVDETSKFYKEGVKLAEEGQFKQAVENFQEALRLNPQYAAAYSALGRTYFKLRQWEKAANNLRRGIELKTKQQQGRAEPNSTKNWQAVSTLAEDNLSLATRVRTVNPQVEMGRQPGQTEEPRTLKITPTNSQIKQPQETNANTVGVTTGTPKSATTQQAPQVEEAGSPVKTVPPQIKQPQETNANGAGVKPLSPEFEKTQESEEAVARVAPLESVNRKASEGKEEPTDDRFAKSITPTITTAAIEGVTPMSAEVPSDDVSLTQIYHVGPNDVLDIRLNDTQSPQSTLFTVTSSGFLEHPMLVEPLPVRDLSVEEIGKRIENDLKKRALSADPKVVVGVRDYASHSILVSGLVKESGTKFLRREAVPLYVVVADAQPLPEAATITVVRNEPNETFQIDLAQPADMDFLVRSGDVITLYPNAMQFIYIGGEVKFPGEKKYRRTLTLRQAILAAGGVSPKSKLAEIRRDDGRGFLVGTRFSLKDIESGIVADPLLKPGDRITVVR